MVQPSRRAVLGGTAAGLATVLASALAGCGTKGTARSTGPASTADLSATEKVLHFSNWPQYIDVDEDDDSKRPTLAAFTKATGIAVTYTEDVNDNEEFFAKIRPAAVNGQSIGRDLFVVSDWMSARMMRQQWVTEFDRSAMPNVAANLDPALRDVGFDPGRRFSIPWASGITGIAYNRRLVGRELREVKDLFAADLRGQVSKGQVRSFTGNEYTAALAKGQLAACFAWSGDVLQLALDNPDLRFVVPEAGGELWSDTCMMPAPVSHRANAQKLVDWYYQPQVAAALGAWVQYVPPVRGAQEAMMKIDPSWQRTR